MNIPYVFKKCSYCGKWLVASTVNFKKQKNGKYGLNSKCKECEKKYNKQWREANKDKRREYNKQWYQDNRNKKLEYQKQWHQDNRDKKLEYDKRHYEANPEYYKQYYQSPKGQVVRFNSHHKRRIKEEQQGTGITKDQWLELMNFFDWKCAYSGETLSKNTRSIDHIVPLNSNGDNMIWNCVPMLRSLNSSKNTKDMEEWYKEQDFYNSSRLQKIYEWQEYAYNKWGKDTQYFNTNDIQIKLL